MRIWILVFAMFCFSLTSPIGEGTHSSVYRDESGLVVKKYFDKGELPEEFDVIPFLHFTAERELEIGQLLDHPNIIKVVSYELMEHGALVSMEFVPGIPFDFATHRSLALRPQFFSAIDHCLERGVLPDDLWSDNILIDGDHLTLIDVGGYELFGEEELLSAKHYFDQIYRMARQFPGEDLPYIEFTNEEIAREDIIEMREWIRRLI